MKRIFLVVLDACGIGAMPDYISYGDSPNCNTLANTLKYNYLKYNHKLNIPNLESLGLGNLLNLNNNIINNNIIEKAFCARMAEKSAGKDTTTGHWEIAGIILKQAFPLYTKNGFPEEIIQEFIDKTGCSEILCNKSASGTEIINSLGQEHIKTGFPIIYTSADSVFQIATHIETIELEKLYSWCEIARKILTGKHEVARVIARPFYGDSQTGFVRFSEGRKDYSIEPKEKTILDFLIRENCEVISIGKIADIFCNKSISYKLKGKSNIECLANITESIKNINTDNNFNNKNKLYFANLVETDSHFGHRNDPVGFGKALELIDISVGHWLENLKQDDLLIITADHGCDPTDTSSTDHTREYTPLLVYNKNISTPTRYAHFPLNDGDQESVYTRESFSDIATSIADYFGLKDQWLKFKSPEETGESFFDF